MQLNPTQKSKIKAFLADSIMSETIFDVLIYSFLKPHPQNSAKADVYVLAASRIAIDLLDDAMRELRHLELQEDTQNEKIQNIGL